MSPEKIECDDCHQFYTRNGMPLHKLAKHSLQGIGGSMSPSIEKTTDKSEEREEKAMADPEKKPFCPECQQKDFTAQLVERDHKAEVEKIRAEAANLTAALTAERNKPTPEPATPVETHATPTAELFDHWANCPTCKPMLEERAKTIRANVFNSMDTAELAQVMKRLGVKPAPKEIIITTGDK